MSTTLDETETEIKKQTNSDEKRLFVAKANPNT